MATDVTTSAPPDAYTDLVASWRLALRAANRSPATVRIYLGSCAQLRAYLAEQGMPLDPAHVHREHVESYVTAVLATSKPATASTRFKALQQWFRWLEREGEITRDPMARMTAPSIPETLAPVLPADALKRLLGTCKGKGFYERRDAALLSLLIDSGLRRAEAAGLRVEDVDLEQAVVRVLGKGSRVRLVPFGATTAAALDRYRRVRRAHPQAALPVWWLGHMGALGQKGVYEIVVRRGGEAGLTLHPHQLRHQFAHQWLAGGGQEHDLMRLAGWRSREMLNRYGAGAAHERAIAAYRGRSPVDGL